MQFVLVDTWETVCSPFTTLGIMGINTHPGYLRFIATDLQRAERNRYNDSNDEVGKLLASEMLSGRGLWAAIVISNQGNEGWGILNGNIFQKLSNRFPGKMAFDISVCLETSFCGQTIDIASLKGRKVDVNNFICTGTFHASALAGISKKEIKKIHFKLVVNVPEKPAIPITKEGESIECLASKKVLEEGLFSDVIISVGDGIDIKAHKSFLSASSPVLKRMFENEMNESKTGEVEMPDASEQGVRAFLRYLYYGDLKEPKEDIEVAFELLSTAHKYDVRNLESEMVKCLMVRNNEDFTVKLAFRIYMFVRNIESAVELKEKMIQILKSQLDEFRTLQEYKDLFEKPSNSNIAMELFMDFAKPTST